jgi:hypothetical protein
MTLLATITPSASHNSNLSLNLPPSWLRSHPPLEDHVHFVVQLPSSEPIVIILTTTTTSHRRPYTLVCCLRQPCSISDIRTFQHQRQSFEGGDKAKPSFYWFPSLQPTALEGWFAFMGPVLPDSILPAT